MSDTSKRRWFQVSIREAALLILAVGFAFAWYSERSTWMPVRHSIEQLRLIAPAAVASPSSPPRVESHCVVNGYPVTVIVYPKEDDPFAL